MKILADTLWIGGLWFHQTLRRSVTSHSRGLSERCCIAAIVTNTTRCLVRFMPRCVGRIPGVALVTT